MESRKYIANIKYTEHISFVDARKRLQPSSDLSKMPMHR